MPDVGGYLLFVAAGVGHAAVWVPPLNFLYSRPISKSLLKPYRLFTGLVILAGWVAFPLAAGPDPADAVRLTLAGEFGLLPRLYLGLCLVMGLVVFPAITAGRVLRKPPAAVRSESTHTLDLWPELGHKLLGDAKYRHLPRLPFNCVFDVDFTDLELELPRLPPAWAGLTVVHLSDLHFLGTPSRAFFDRVIDEILECWPVPDLVCLTGDYVDTDTHREWIVPVLGRLKAAEAKLAILGNHDEHHDPDAIRSELTAAGYQVLSNRPGANEPRVLTVRGEPLTVIGHEGPWFRPDPDLSEAAEGPFRLLLSHTPDHFAWAVRHRIDLMLAGHVHGGQVRVPVVGSIFVPSGCGRRYDMGTFAAGPTVMHVVRGLSGKEPLRFRCHPQVTRITLRAKRPAG